MYTDLFTQSNNVGLRNYSCYIYCNTKHILRQCIKLWVVWFDLLLCCCCTAQVETLPVTIRYWHRHTMTRVDSLLSAATLPAHLYDLCHLHQSLSTLPQDNKVVVVLYHLSVSVLTEVLNLVEFIVLSSP